MAWWLALSAIGKAAGAVGKAAKIGAAVSKLQSKQETMGAPPIAGIVNDQGAQEQAEKTMAQELRKNQMIGGMR